MVEITGAPGAIEKKAEKKDSREAVVKAFNTAYSELDSAYKKGGLSEEEAWTYEAIKAAKEKTLDQGKDTFTNRFQNLETDKWYSQEEGIPIEGLLAFLQKRIDSLAKKDPERKRLFDAASIIYKNSKRYSLLPHRMEPQRLLARVRQEANLTSKDIRATGSEETDYLGGLDTLIGTDRKYEKGRDTAAKPTKEDKNRRAWYSRGQTALNRRLELVLPSDKTPKTPTKPKPVPGPTKPPEPTLPPGPEPPAPDPTPPVVPEPTTPPPAPTPEPEPNPLSPPDPIRERRYDFLMINAMEAVSKNALLQARKSVNESLRKPWWQIWRLPQKIGLRLIEGGELYRRKLGLQKIMVENNTSFLSMGEAKQGANLSLRKTEAKTQQEAIVKRFTAEQGIQKGEEAVVASGELKKMIINEILKPITDGTITNDDQIREALSVFVRNHLNDPQVETLFGANANDFGDIAQYFATNLLEMGLRIKEDLGAHNETLEQIDQLITIRLGNARLGAMTETRSAVDRAVAWAQRRRSQTLVRGARGLGYTGIVLNPLVVGAATSLATAGLMRSVGYAGRAAQVSSFFTGGAAGAVMAGARRYYELGVYDRPTYMVQRAIGETITPKQHATTRLGRLMERMAGEYRNEDLEKRRYNMASTDQLIYGRGQELISGMERKSIQDLLGLDLNQGDPEDQLRNRESIARRITEIQTRLDLSRSKKVDLIEFKNLLEADLSPTQLIELAVKLRFKLKDTLKKQHESAGLNAEDADKEAQKAIDNLEKRFTTEWESKLIDNVNEQNRSFQVYRLRNALGAGVFGGAVGFTGGLVSQQVFTEIARYAPGFSALPLIGGLFRPGRTALESAKESILGATPIAEASTLAEHGLVGFNQNVARDLYLHPRPFRLSDHFTMIVDSSPQHYGAVTIIDDNGIKIPLSSARLDPDGKLFITGNPNTFPDELKRFFSDMEQHPGAPGIRDEIRDMIKEYRHETIQRGNFIFDINDKEYDQWTGGQGKMSFEHTPSNTQVHGFARLDGDMPTFDIDTSFDGNADISQAHWDLVRQDLEKEGWNVIIDNEQKPVLGPQGEWAQHTTPVEREWYAYNTPWSEKNELQEYGLNKIGTTVSLDMSAMGISEQKGLTPPNINVQDVIKNHQAAWAFSLPGQETHPIIVSDGADGVWDGRLKLDPNDTNPNHVIQAPNGPMQLGKFAQIVLNQEKLSRLPDGDIATEYYTNIKGEYRLDVWRLNGGIKNGVGLISAGELVDDQNGKHVFKSFATIRGTGETPDKIGKNIWHVSPPDTFEYDPPIVPPVEPPPLIPLPFAPRHPLEPLRPPFPPGSPYIERFRPDHTLEDLIRFGKPGERKKPSQPTNTNSPRTLNSTAETEGKQEGKQALTLIHDTFQKSPHIYVALSSAIGDTAITTAYIEGLRQYAETASINNKKITLVVPPNITDLLRPLAEKYNYEIIVAERHHCIDRARELTKSSNEKDTIIFDFDFTEEFGPNPILEVGDDDNLIVHELLSTAIGLYTNDRSGIEKFSEYLGDLLKIPKGQQISLQPTLVLPKNPNTIYDNLKTKFKIDSGKKQVSVILEGSTAYKRYKLDGWKAVLREIQSDDMELNIIFNPSAGNYTEEQLTQMFSDLKGFRLITLTLPESMIFLQKQNLVLSNDTGLAHIAAIIENGPRVISLHAYNNLPNVWVSNTKRQFGIWSGKENLPVDAIPPEKVIEKTREFLST